MEIEPIEQKINRGGQAERLKLSSEWKLVEEYFDDQIEKLKDVRNIKDDYEIQVRVNSIVIEMIENLKAEIQNLIYEAQEAKKLIDK
jgi:hypothetical protein